jgi:hypothetical protein
MVKPPKPAGKNSTPSRAASPIDALHELSNARAKPAQVLLLFKRMFKTLNDRGAAVLLEAYLEDSLQRAIELVLNVRDKQRPGLFGPNAPLGTFADKIRIAQALDIIGPKTQSNLERIREIRNTLAYSKIHLSFKTKEVAKACKSLTVPQDMSTFPFFGLTNSARNKFETVCFITARNLEITGGFLKAVVPHRSRA